MKLLERFVLILAVALGLPVSAEAENVDTSARPAAVRTVDVPVELQPWQQRREEFFETLRGVYEGNITAVRRFDTILTEFETKPFSRTPMEHLDVLGAFYIPREGVEPAFQFIVMHAVLGWYDTLRFGSTSATAEIFTNARFFLIPFLLGGPRVKADARAFFKLPAERRAKHLQAGIALAEKFRNAPKEYDQHWPTAYGLERMAKEMNVDLDKKPEELPKEQWDKAWLDAKQFVTMFYMELCPQYLEAIDKSSQAR